MSNSATKVMDRFLSVLLALVMVIGMLPVTVFASAADYEGQYVITVKEQGGSAISEATIAYQIKVDGSQQTTGNVTTDADGTAGIDLNEYQTQIDGDQTVTIAYTVTKSGYTTASGEITVESVDGTSDIQMQKEAEPAEQVTVTVTVTGAENGTVKLNGSEQSSVTVDKGADVSIELTPKENCYIKSLTVGGEEKTVEKGQTYTDTIKPEEATTISVTFIKEVTVSVSANEGGKVLLNGGEVEPVTVDKGTSVSLKVTPDSGYQISSVTIGGAPEEITNLYSFEKNITANDDVTISVAFVKEWVITVTYNEESGTVETTPENQGGSVTVKAGDTVNITATPNPNCRVSKVTINGVDEIFNDNTYSHIGDVITAYTKVLTANTNYTIEIVFASTCFNVTYEENPNATITVDAAKVDFGKNTTAEITVKGDYNIIENGIKVNGVPVGYIRTSNRTVGIAINGITVDQKIEVELDKMAETNELPADVAAFKDSAIRTDEESGLYVYKKDATVTFTTDKEGIAINEITDDGIQYRTNSVTLTGSTTVNCIYLFYENAWHKITPEKPIKIVIDNQTVTAPQLTPDAPHANDYYNKDFNVAVVARDTGDYSGIAKVEYWITSEEQPGIQKETQRETLYTYDDGDILDRWTEKPIVVDTTKNNSDKVIVHVQVTDRAGNQSDVVTCEMKVNSTAPVITVDMKSDPQPHKEAMPGFYTSARTAVVTVVDRSTTFNETAMTDAIVIEANGQPVTAKAAMIQWTNGGDQHQATITFSTDAKYTWHIEKYTNGAGLANGDITATGEHVYEFTVDSVAPTAKIEMDGKTWDKIISFLTFGMWKNYSVTATVKDVKDATSDVKTTLYYKSDKTKALNESELDQLFADGAFVEETYTVSSDEVFTIYARITDYAGNTVYISTNGAIYDKSKGEITFDIDEPNENGVHVDDVNVRVSVDDTLVAGRAGSVSSGIKTIDYKVEARFPGSEDLKTTQSDNLYTFDLETTDEHPTYDELKLKWDNNDKPIVVSKEKNNSSYIIVTITVVDNAGNTYSKTSDPLSISTDKPTAVISYENEGIKDTRKQDDHFTSRTAVILVTDRNDVFDGAAAKAGIKLKATNSNGSDIELEENRDYTISAWDDKTVDNRDTHTAKVEFLKDGNYTIGFNYLNKTNDEPKRVIVEDETFTKDATDPTGTVTIATNTWDKLLKVLTFGLYSKTSVDVSATAKDDTSKVVTEYYKDNGDTILTADELATKEFKTFEPFSVDSDERFTVYLKITDYAGNFIYLSSDGYIVDMKDSVIVKPVQEDFNGVYNKDVEIPIEITDAEPYSGIKRVDYRVIKDGNEAEPTQQGNLFTFSEKNPSHDKLRNEWTGSITVEAGKNNSNNVVVVIEAEDNAGHITTKSISLKIDITAPVIALSYPGDDIDNNGNTYFDHTRTATVVITKRTAQFNAEKATAGIKITAVDAKGAAVNDSYKISEWDTVEGATPDDAKHTATIQFQKDANYTLEISYTDEAGNPNAEITDVTGVAPWDFTVDTTPPTGTVKATSAEGREAEWNELLPSLTYGFWSNKEITITGTQDDATSAPIASVEYYKVTSQNANDNVEALTEDALDAVTSWTPFDKVEATANEQFVLYLKITDLAGNYTYICTDGLIVDDQAPIEETIAPEITVNPEQPINGLYNSDVDVAIEVEDPLVGGTYSGLKTVSYRVLNMGEETQSETLYTFNEKNPTQSDLLKDWTGSITVDRTLNNSNDVKIEVIAEDNSGNTSRKAVSIKIDITAPKIDVSYNNDSPDSNSFFKEDRTATVVVTERNFDPKDVKVTITNTDGVIPSLSEWKQTSAGTGNQDDATWEATITYSADGDYTFDITYTDLAANLMSGVSYGKSVAATAFTIDKTIPVIGVVYDNDSADRANKNYYKKERTATITITEHNFNADRVNIKLTATDDGKTVKLPTVSGWTSNGNEHKATIRYAADALYSFDIAFNDMAGNASADFAQQIFYVDKTNPTLQITGVANNSANNGKVIPVVSYSDTNYDSTRVAITLSGKNRGEIKELDGSYKDIHNGRTFTFANFENKKEIDDIYTLFATLTDKAGNTTKQIITFSVNRFGSTYAVSDDTKALNGNYVKTPKDVVLTETNADKLSDITITLFKNNETITLKEGDDYKIDVTGGNGEWYQYTYTILAKNFEDDGVYRISVHSKDAAGNVAENSLDTKNTEITFGVDKTKPTLVVTNLENGVTYPRESMTVRMSSDDNLLLNSIAVYLDNYDTAYKTWNAEEIASVLAGNGEFNFDISGDSTKAHKVKVVSTDAAGNETVEEITDFFVTTNIWVRYYNNKPLFFGSIGGVILLAALIVVIVVLKRRKKERQ